MKEIPLTQGKVALVDDEDYDELIKHRWFAIRDGRTFYASRHVGRGRTGRKLQGMHRLLLGLSKGELADHIDHNGLNNQRCNLRKCSALENARNTRSHAGVSSQFRGVSKHTTVRKGKRYYYWRSAIQTTEAPQYLGTFPFTNEGEILAARRYDEQARSRYGEFANCNFK